MNGRGRNGEFGQHLRTKIRDEKGHYERWPETKVHPDVDTAVRAYLSDPACEYESMSDLIRGLVIEGILRKRAEKESTKSILTILKTWTEANRKVEMRRRFKQHIEETAREAYELVGEGKTGEAAKHIHQILLTIRDLPAEDPWRAECEELLKQKFGYLLRMTQAASLVPEESESESGGKLIEWERYKKAT